MVRRTPSQYDWSKLQFDETILTKHFTPQKSKRVRYIVVHHMTILGDGKGKALDACWNVWQNRQASAHYGVDGGLVRQYVWDKDYAWATGSTAGNRDGISIEHANSTAGPKWLVSDQTWKTGARLAAQLHHVYGLGRPVSGVTLRKHSAFVSTACPGPFLGGTQWGKYVAEAQRVYDEITNATPPKTPKPLIRWHSTAFLNVWGDDGGTGQRSFDDRLPTMVKDVTSDRDDVIGFCEVRPEQEPKLTKAMKAAGYKRAGYSHRLALYVLPEVKVGGVSFAACKTQNKGAIEGILRARLTVAGHRINYGITHLDYRDGFDKGRVKQMAENVSAMKRFGLARWPTSWKTRTVIPGDFNSKKWVTDALADQGFKDAGAGAAIDFIVSGRAFTDASRQSTKSDHPIIRATIGKKK